MRSSLLVAGAGLLDVIAFSKHRILVFSTTAAFWCVKASAVMMHLETSNDIYWDEFPSSVEVAFKRSFRVVASPIFFFSWISSLQNLCGVLCQIHWCSPLTLFLFNEWFQLKMMCIRHTIVHNEKKTNRDLRSHHVILLVILIAHYQHSMIEDKMVIRHWAKRS